MRPPGSVIGVTDQAAVHPALDPHVNGRLAASTAPGLGVTPRTDVLGRPVVVVE